VTAACFPFPAGVVPAAAVALTPSGSAGGQTGDEFAALMSALLSGATAEAPETTQTPVPAATSAQPKSNPGVSRKSGQEPEKQPSLLAGFPIPGFLPMAELPRLPLAEPGLPDAATAPGDGPLTVTALCDAPTSAALSSLKQTLDPAGECPSNHPAADSELPQTFDLTVAAAPAAVPVVAVAPVAVSVVAAASVAVPVASTASAAAQVVAPAPATLPVVNPVPVAAQPQPVAPTPLAASVLPAASVAAQVLVPAPAAVPVVTPVPVAQQLVDPAPVAVPGVAPDPVAQPLVVPLPVTVPAAAPLPTPVAASAPDLVPGLPTVPGPPLPTGFPAIPKAPTPQSASAPAPPLPVPAAPKSGLDSLAANWFQSEPAAAPDAPQQTLAALAPVLAPAPEDELPGTSRQPAAKTELAFAARLTEQTSASAAPGGSRLASTPSKEDAPAVPQPEPTPAAGAPPGRSGRPTLDRAPEKAVPEHAAAEVKPAASRSDPLSSVGPGLPQRISADLVAGARAPASAAAPRDLQSATAALLDVESARLETRSQPLREISVLIPQPAAEGTKPEAVEVRLLDRAGQVHVAVRTGDARLSQSLGAQLGDLVTQLEHSGYRTETWRPADSTAVAGVSGVAETSPQQLQSGPDRDGYSGSGRQQQGGNADSSSQQQRQDQEQARPQWLNALEESLPPQTNSIRSMTNELVS